jgi:hypothetical protein
VIVPNALVHLASGVRVRDVRQLALNTVLRCARYAQWDGDSRRVVAMPFDDISTRYDQSDGATDEAMWPPALRPLALYFAAVSPDDEDYSACEPVTRRLVKWYYESAKTVDVEVVLVACGNLGFRQLDARHPFPAVDFLTSHSAIEDGPERIRLIRGVCAALLGSRKRTVPSVVFLNVDRGASMYTLGGDKRTRIFEATWNRDTDEGLDDEADAAADPDAAGSGEGNDAPAPDDDIIDADTLAEDGACWDALNKLKAKEACTPEPGCEIRITSRPAKEEEAAPPAGEEEAAVLEPGA